MHRTTKGLLLTASLLGTAHAQAIPPSSTTTQGTPASTGLTPVTVTATHAPVPDFDVPAAIGVVTDEDIVPGPPAFSLAQSLARIPGVVAQNRLSYAQDLQISIRGFGARASFGVRGIRLLVDGIPASSPAGQGQTDTFDLAIADRIEVLRGPFSALYGNAAGGVIQTFTRDGPPRPTVNGSLLAGSHGTRIERLGAGGTLGPFNYIVDAVHFRTDGYREHSAARRDNLRGKFRYDLDDDASLTLLLNGENQPFARDPSGLNRKQLRENRRQAVAQVYRFGAGESHRDRQGGIVYRQPLDDNDTLRMIGYAGSRRVIQFLPFAGTSPGGGGAVVDLDNDSVGGEIRWTHGFTLAGAPLDVIAGVQYQRLHEQRKGFVNDHGTEGALRRNEDDTSSQSGTYAEAHWKLAHWRLTAGLRHSRIRFDSHDHYITPANPDDSGSRHFSRTSPVLGVLYKVNPQLNLYANYGRGFETPTLAELAYRGNGNAGFHASLQPSTSRSYEAGMKVRWDRARLDFAFFRITTDDDIVVASSRNGRTSYRNAGRTQRRGVEISFDDRIGAGFDVHFNYSYLHARFDGGPLDGKRLPGVPRQSAWGQLRWQYRSLGFSTALSTQWRDRVYVDNANTDVARRYIVFNYQLGFKQRANGWQFDEFARINNLFDRRYVGAVIVNAGNGRYFQPAATRSVLVGVRAHYMF